jgi:hypothetical protein
MIQLTRITNLKGNNIMFNLSKSVLTIISTTVLLLYAGCAGLPSKDYGKISLDPSVTGAFESFEIDQDLNYYISGVYAYPNALIGLKKSYTLDSTLWKKVKMTPELFQEIVLSMQERAFQISHPQYGSAIFDNKGNRIGVWYSILPAITSVKMENEHTASIPTPDIRTYDKYEP